jgi:uncharacterized protein
VNIWVDADACPVQIRELVARAAHRRSVATIFIANKSIPLLQSPFVSSVCVPPDPDAADIYIAEKSQPGDLVVTQDIPLAAQLVPRGIVAISPRGMLFTKDNVADQLSRRDLLSELRDSGLVTTSMPPLDQAMVRRFASQFDAALHRLLKP